jgi:hypothetical protein
MAHHPHNMASGLASLGRGGDSMLVHMSPREVAGLQSLAMKHGGSLTRNPHTGLPEAFSLKSLLPLAGGLLLDAFAPDFAANNAFALSVGTGLVDKLAGGSWADAFSAGFGMYGGIESGQSLSKLGSKDLTSALASNSAVDPNSVALTDAKVEDALSTIKPPTGPIMIDSSSMQGPWTSVGQPLASGTGFVSSDIGGSYLPASGTFDADIMASPPSPVSIPQTPTAPSRGGMMAGLNQFTKNPVAAAQAYYAGLGSNPFAQKAALMGTMLPIMNAINGGTSGSSDLPAASAQNQWYVPAPGYNSLFRKGTVNPDIAKYGYLPVGEQPFIGQGWNPGVWTNTPPTTAASGTGTGMKEGGLTTLKRFDAGGPTAMETTQLRPGMPTNANPITPEQYTLNNANSYYQNLLSQSMAQSPNINPPPPSPDAMNAYMLRVNQMNDPWQYGYPAGVTGGGTTGGGTTGSGTTGSGTTGGGTTGKGGSGLGGLSLSGVDPTQGGMAGGNSFGDLGGLSFNDVGSTAGATTDSTSASTPPSLPDTTASDAAALAQLQDIVPQGQRILAPKPSMLQRMRQGLQDYQQNHPVLTNTGRVLGALASPGVTAVRGLASAAGIGQPGYFQSLYNSAMHPTVPQGYGNIDYSGSTVLPNEEEMYSPGFDPNALPEIPVVDTMQQYVDSSMSPNSSSFGSGMGAEVGGGGSGGGGFSMDPVMGEQESGVMAVAHGGRIHHMAHGGIADLVPTYAAGGKLLKGPGDGMSDSIPAVIGGHKPQRAALADGEFVIPADVVSHLGNGSTEAGSRKLYEMMDKVRFARTGNRKQGKQINPNKFMPA